MSKTEVSVHEVAVPEPGDDLIGSRIWVPELPPVVSCSAAEDMARQEYALSADLKYQIQRFGVGHHTVSGQVDFDHLDLTTAMALVEESSQAWLRLPKLVRDRYQHWGAVEAAARSGELSQLLKAAGIDGEVVPPSSPDASPSDSAAVAGT